MKMSTIVGMERESTAHSVSYRRQDCCWRLEGVISGALIQSSTHIGLGSGDVLWGGEYYKLSILQAVRILPGP